MVLVTMRPRFPLVLTRYPRSFAGRSLCTAGQRGLAKLDSGRAGAARFVMLRNNRTKAGAALSLCAAAATCALFATAGSESRAEGSTNSLVNTQPLFNWSATQSCLPLLILKPDSHEQVVDALSLFARKCGEKIRVMGSGLSPNGLAFSDETLLTLENMSRVIRVDKEKCQVTVQAGILVGELLEELAEHGLTLQNLASIDSQQIGGFTQAGAHGTGASLPPVEEQIVAMTIATPGLQTVELSASKSPDWFRLAKVGLGCFGVVTELTLQCVPAHKLVETTTVLSRKEVRKGHVERLQKNRHVRYMWLPYTDYAVVVTSNPTAIKDEICNENPSEEPSMKESIGVALKTKPLIDLYLNTAPGKMERASLEKRGFGELRDLLIAIDPHSRDHIEVVNKAELEFWRNSQNSGAEPEDSANVLGFDCGGQQLVLEVAFPCGSQTEPNFKDLDFIDDLLAAVEDNPSIAAPSPIEQRWTCGSSAALSPAGVSTNPQSALFSWVGIIMYLPTDLPDQRKKIQNSFEEYVDLLHRLDEQGGFGVKTHWAKIQVPSTVEQTQALKEKLFRQYPLEEWNAARALFDPSGSLSNQLLDTLLKK